MITVGIVSPGAMGAAIGHVLASGGARVVATVADRSKRTQRLAGGLTLLPTLDEVVGESAIVLSVVPPDAAVEVAGDIAAATGRTGAQPLVVDLNAISPPPLVRSPSASPSWGSTSSTARSPDSLRASPGPP